MAATVMTKWTGVKVFSATMSKERENLGQAVTDWVKHTKVDVVETVVTQSSDSEYHCLAITVFYNEKR